MKTGIIIYSNDAETVWNAFRFANFSLKEGDTVKIFYWQKELSMKSLIAKNLTSRNRQSHFLKITEKLLPAVPA